MNYPKIRSDLRYYPDPADEERLFIKDPVSGNFFRYNALQVAMMKALDGKRSIADVKEAIENEFDAEVPEAAIRRFITRLESNLLLDITSYSVNDQKTRAYILKVLRKKNLALRVKARDGTSQEGQLFERATKELLEGDPCKAARDLQAVLEINPNNSRARQIIDAIHVAYFKMKAAGPGHAKLIHLIDPDKMLAAYARVFGKFVFSRWGLFFVIALILSGIPSGMIVLSDPGALTRGFGVFDALVFLVFWQVLAFVHEIHHGFAVKHYGGETHDAGWMILFGFVPVAYCDTSDSYRFARRRDKIVVQLAGGLAHLAFAAVLFHFLAITDASLPIWQGIAVVNIATLLPNINNLVPLMKWDGYYALVDYLNIPNLRERSFALLSDRLKSKLLGLPSQVTENNPRERRIFVIYGILAVFYTFFYTYFLYVYYLLPVAVRYLGVFGFGIAAVFFFNYIGRKFLFEIVKFSYRVLFRHRRIIFTPRRSLAFAAVIGAIALLLSAPWPLRVSATFEVEPNQRAVIRATEPGLVEEMLVKEGAHVEAGQVIARLRADDLVRDYKVAAQELAIAKSHLALLRAGARPELIALAKARTRTANVESAVAARRATETRTLRRLEVESAQTLRRAQQTAAAASGEARVSAAQTEVDTARTREEDLAAAEAEVNHWRTKRDELDQRVRQLEITSPIAGVVATKRVIDLVGKRLGAGAVLLEVHDTSSWTARLTPELGEPHEGLAPGQAVLLAAHGDPHRHLNASIDRMLPPPDANASPLFYTKPIVYAGWRSGMTGRARIYGPTRSIGHQLIVLPLVRLISFELPKI